MGKIKNVRYNFHCLTPYYFALCNTSTLLDRPGGQTSWKDQLDGPAGQTSWTDQLDGPAGQTTRMNQLDGPAGRTSWADQLDKQLDRSAGRTSSLYLKPCSICIFEDYCFSLYIVEASESDEGLLI